jgi:toxin HigB-1
VPHANSKHSPQRFAAAVREGRWPPAAAVDKLRDMLLAVQAAREIDDLAVMPGWRLHPLKGRLAGYWSLTVTGNWRLIFKFEDGEAYDLDLLDYH